MSTFKCELLEQPAATIMKLRGEINFADMQEFDKHAKHIAGTKARTVVLDMSDLEMISSAGIGGLLRLQKTLSGHKCNVRLAALPDNISKIFQAAKLSELFKITQTVDEAMH
jgi:anti-sigma B factor antagonist